MTGKFEIKIGEVVEKKIRKQNMDSKYG